jgi:hypothetical protein
MRVVHRGLRISNLVDHPCLVVTPAAAGTTAPRPQRRLQASSAAMSAPERSRSMVPIRARCEPSSDTRSAAITPALE